MDVFEYLRRNDGLKRISNLGVSAFMHEDHRWALPLIAQLQKTGELPCPVKLIMFDAHHDSLEPKKISDVRSLGIGATPEVVVGLCEQKLSKNDDDWVIAGMELGMISDAVIFGVMHGNELEKPFIYRDQRGVGHTIWSAYSLPGGSLGYQGDLSDHARSEHLETLWGLLDWRMTDGKFGFAEDLDPILLNIDLDCFSGSWRGVTCSWPNKVYWEEFQKESTYALTRGWSGKSFFDALRKRAGAVMIAREPACCGGESQCGKNAKRVAHHLFDLKSGFELDV